ncbi:hypothetical protein PPYR_10643 [Photinus pyralis]|uniref:RAB6-interacting golgin n=1 Tax=Photinus pyralis TaxID=7054 RepID=A0A1Y1KHQ3_PHOPY|nr:hypothetical protein PPYR_10643 [Photinus pyralis]
MSGSFAGFSEEDIRNLNSKRRGEIQKQELGLKKASLNNNPLRKHTTSINHKTTEVAKKPVAVNPIPVGAKLCPSPEPERAKDTETEHVTTVVTDPQESQCDNEEQSPNNAVDPPLMDTEMEIPISNNFMQLQEKKLDLNEFQERQKLIEEQNKKRKELLAKALAVRTQQTKEEAQKLEKIRSEFKKLDMLLSGDVKILRHQIEIASLDYMEAEKRYYRVEKEYLDAKLALHQRMERKEMLTEHLCAVIEKNEERKAEKLNELLSKLNLKTDFETSSAAGNLQRDIHTADDHSGSASDKVTT